MYSGVNDENNQGAFNDENSLYHYSYSKDREPQPGQPDPSQTSWQPASRSEDPVSPEEPVAYTTGTRQDDPQPPKPEKGSFWKKTGTKVTALVLCCALTGGLCGFGGASLARRGGKATIQESGRTASAVSVKSVDGQTLTSSEADVDTDPNYTPDTEAIVDGYFAESTFRSAPYFDLQIDGINLLDTNFG